MVVAPFQGVRRARTRAKSGRGNRRDFSPGLGIEANDLKTKRRSDPDSAVRIHGDAASVVRTRAELTTDRSVGVAKQVHLVWVHLVENPEAFRGRLQPIWLRTRGFPKDANAVRHMSLPSRQLTDCELITA